MSSATLFAGTRGSTTSTDVKLIMNDTGAKSFSGSKGRFVYRLGLIE